MLRHCSERLSEAERIVEDFVGAKAAQGEESPKASIGQQMQWQETQGSEPETTIISLRCLALKGTSQMVRPPFGPGIVPDARQLSEDTSSMGSPSTLNNGIRTHRPVISCHPVTGPILT